MKRILVTAIHTHLDQLLVEELIQQNYIVRLIARDTDASNPVLKMPVELFPASWDNTSSLAAAVKGCQYIVHTQQPITLQSQPTEVFLSYAAEARELELASKAAGIETLLNILSNSTTLKDTDLPLRADSAHMFNNHHHVQDHLYENESSINKRPDIKIISLQLGQLDASKGYYAAMQKILQILLYGIDGKTYQLGEQKTQRIPPRNPLFSFVTHIRLPVLLSPLFGIGLPGFNSGLFG